MVEIRLEDVIDHIDFREQDAVVFLRRSTGEFISVGGLADDDEEELQGPDYVALPDSFEIDDWDIMRRFGADLEDDAAAAEIARAIGGRGAFRMFRHTVERLGLLERWYEYRDRAYEEIAREWLDANEIPYRSKTRVGAHRPRGPQPS